MTKKTLNSKKAESMNVFDLEHFDRIDDDDDEDELDELET